MRKLHRFFYKLKQEVGLSYQESRGFMVLIPVLLLVLMGQLWVKSNASQKSSISSLQLDYLIDSLNKAGYQPVTSPLPFNEVRDTTRSKPNSALQKIPFSQSDSVTLQIVPGIGPALASRIIKYRESIGGFFAPSQLLEVYGISAEVEQRMWEYFVFDAEISKRLRINELETAELAKHPYIGYGEAKVIVAYRQQHGPYLKAEDLLQIKIFTEDWVKKIAPYLEF